MNVQLLIAMSGFSILVGSAHPVRAVDAAPDKNRILRLATTAKQPKDAIVMKNLSNYLNRQGLANTFVLYSSANATIDALNRGEVDIAWNSPSTHAKFHILSGGSQALAMREVDRGRLTLVARADAKIKSLRDLPGKRLILGHVSYQTEAPIHFLKKAGVNLDVVTLIQWERDRKGASAIEQALADNQADAAVLLESQWKRTKSFRESSPTIQPVWTSPEICHCTFTAAKDFDRELGKTFAKLVTTMDSKDPLVAELNRLERTKSWVPGNPNGFEALVQTLKREGLAKRRTPSARTKDIIRIAGTTYSPDNVTKYQNLKTLFNRNGFPLDFVLYADHKAQVNALASGEVDIMFSSPVPHAMYHLRAGASQTLAMRDVDAGLRVTLLARDDAGIKELNDLAGKRLVLGSSYNAEGALLPLHYLKQEGVDLDKLKVVSLSNERDANGRGAYSTQHILAALAAGRGDAAMVLQRGWKQSAAFRKENPSIRQVWSSPEFCHCTITAPASFDPKLGRKFTNIITNLDSSDPLVTELNRLTHSKKWIESNAEGFQALYEALESKNELLRRTQN